MKERKEQIEEAVKVLRAGGILLYPTDTIWGIGCDATDEKAVERVFEIKQRADSKSLIILASDLTIIYPEGINLAPNVTAEDGSIAIRIPKNDFCVELVRRFGKPIVSTSANVSGTPAPRRYIDIPDTVKASVNLCIDPSFDQGSTGKASSIIKLGLHNEVQVIRE